jgi:hypothetical protein
MARRNTIEIVITSKDQASGVIKNITTGALRRLGEEAINIAKQLPRAAVEMVKLGATAERQRIALDNLAASFGQSGEEIIDAIQNASDFTIDSMTAMEAANKAMLLSVAKTPEEFARITRVATVLGRAMGQDAAKSIDDFVVAAGRQSVLMADNLGLLIKQGDLQDDVNRIMKETPGISEAAAKSQAFLNEMLSQGEELTEALGNTGDDTATKIEKLGAAAEDAKTGFATMLASMVTGADESGQAIDELAERIRALPQRLSEVVSMLFAAAAGVSAFVLSLGNMEEVERVVAEAIEASQKFMGMYVEETEKAIGPTEELIQAQSEIPGIGNALGKLSTVMGDVAAAFDRGGDSATGNSIVMERLGTIVENVEAAFDQGGESVEEWIDSLAEAHRVAVDAAVSFTGLTQSLFDAADASIATAAMNLLRQSLQEGTLSSEEYTNAVTQLSLQFGLASPESIKLALSMQSLTARFAEGALSAEAYNIGIQTLTANMPTTTAEITEMERAQEEAARDFAALAEEARMTAAALGDDFVVMAGDAAEETDFFSLALFNATDEAGASAEVLAILGAELGLYTQAEAEAALAAVVLQAKISELGKAIVDESISVADAIKGIQDALAQFPEGARQMEAALQDTNKAAADSKRWNRELARRQREAEKATRKQQQELERSRREMERVNQELERLAAKTGDVFIDKLPKATEEVDEWSLALFQAADAAGADAQELALLAGALGLYTEEQIEAALAAAAMQEKLDELGKRIAEGLGIGEAIQEFNKFRETLLELPALPEWIEPGSKTPFEIGLLGIGSAMRDLSLLELPRLEMSLDSASGGRGRFGQQQTSNFNLTVNTSAPLSNVRQDFQTMRSLN